MSLHLSVWFQYDQQDWIHLKTRYGTFKKNDLQMRATALQDDESLKSRV